MTKIYPDMMPENIDYRKLRTPTDVRLAREKLRYSLAYQEQIVNDSFSKLGRSISDTFRSVAYGIGAKLAFTLVSNLLRRKNKS